MKGPVGIQGATRQGAGTRQGATRGGVGLGVSSESGVLPLCALAWAALPSLPPPIVASHGCASVCPLLLAARVAWSFVVVPAAFQAHVSHNSVSLLLLACTPALAGGWLGLF